MKYSSVAKCPASCCKLAVLERDGRVCGASRGILACRLAVMSRHVYHVYHVHQRPSPPVLAFAQGVAIKIWGECYVITVRAPQEMSSRLTQQFRPRRRLRRCFCFAEAVIG